MLTQKLGGLCTPDHAKSLNVFFSMVIFYEYKDAARKFKKNGCVRDCLMNNYDTLIFYSILWNAY